MMECSKNVCREIKRSLISHLFQYTHAGVHKHAQSLEHAHVKVKVSSYIARYPVLMTVNALHILCPWQTCSINDLSTALGNIQPYIEYILYVIYIESCKHSAR